MIKPIYIQDADNAQRLLEMQIPSYLVEAKLIGSEDIPPLRDTTDSLQACGETFFVYEVEGVWGGAISYERAGEVVTICRVMVHPDYFRRGIARELLQHLLAAEATAKTFRVSTGASNHPALALYRKQGFQEVAQREVAPGLWLTFLEKGSLA